jgi:predicted transcriptional regulator
MVLHPAISRVNPEQFNVSLSSRELEKISEVLDFCYGLTRLIATEDVSQGDFVFLHIRDGQLFLLGNWDGDISK